MNALPRPGATELENLVATLLRHGNTPETLNLDRIALGRRFGADQILVEFRLQQNGKRKLPEETAAEAPALIQQEEEEE